LSQVLSKVTIVSCSFYIRYSKCLLLDDALKTATPLTNAVIIEMLRHITFHSHSRTILYKQTTLWKTPNANDVSDDV